MSSNMVCAAGIDDALSESAEAADTGSPTDVSEGPRQPRRVPAGFSRRFQAALPYLLRIISVGAFFVAWEIYGQAQETTLFFAPFSEVVESLYDQVQTSEFWNAYRQTLQPFLYGWLLAMATGIPLGLLIGRFTSISRISGPYLSFLNAVPVSTLVPVVVVAFGIGMTARVSVVFLFAIVEIVINTAAGVRFVNKELVEMGRSFGGNEWQLMRRIILPGSMPGIAAGARIGTGRAVIGMIVVEVLLVSVGVGRLVDRFRSRFQGAALFAVVLSLAIFGVAMLELVRQIERRALRWRRESGLDA